MPLCISLFGFLNTSARSVRCCWGVRHAPNEIYTPTQTDTHSHTHTHCFILRGSLTHVHSLALCLSPYLAYHSRCLERSPGFATRPMWTDIPEVDIPEVVCGSGSAQEEGQERDMGQEYRHNACTRCGGRIVIGREHRGTQRSTAERGAQSFMTPLMTSRYTSIPILAENLENNYGTHNSWRA